MEAGSPRASGIRGTARECNREAEGLPQLLSTDKTSVQVSPSRTPSTARAEGQSLQRFPRVADKGFSHHHSLSVDSGGPARLSPCPQAAAMFCQSAGARGAARAGGLPEGLRGVGLAVGATPTHPLTPQLPCPPSPAPRGAATGPAASCGSGVAARDCSPWDPSPQQQVMCWNHRPARWRDVWGLTPARHNRSNPGLSKYKIGLGRTKQIVDFTFL